MLVPKRGDEGRMVRHKGGKKELGFETESKGRGEERRGEEGYCSRKRERVAGEVSTSS